MSTKHTYRAFGLAVALCIALASGWYVYQTMAQQPTQLFTLGLDQQKCDRTNQDERAGTQSEPIGIVLRGFYSQEPVYLSVTFPDGRVFSLLPASLNPPNTPGGLDGLIDRPDNPAYTVQTSLGGDFYQMLLPNTKWPYGCYTFNALGVNSGNRAMGFYVVKDVNELAIDPGQTSLQVVNNRTKQARGPQGSVVDVFGRGFRGSEKIALTLQKPDGALLELPASQTSPIGSFQSSLTFETIYPTGRYTFVASDGTSSISRTFTLEPAQIKQVGWARLRIAGPEAGAIKQNVALEIQGQQFMAGEPIIIRAILPNGAIQELLVTAADENGEFVASVTLDERYPIGRYRVYAEGQVSEFVTLPTDGADSFNLLAGSQHVTEATLVVNPPADNAPGDPPAAPTVEPTLEPTVEPTLEPTVEPTLEPTVAPTLEPTPVMLPNTGTSTAPTDEQPAEAPPQAPSTDPLPKEALPAEPAPAAPEQPGSEVRLPSESDF